MDPGTATIDRLRHRAYKIVLEGKSYRSPHAHEHCQRTNKKSKKEAKKTDLKGSSEIVFGAF